MTSTYDMSFGVCYNSDIVVAVFCTSQARYPEYECSLITL